MDHTAQAAAFQEGAPCCCSSVGDATVCSTLADVLTVEQDACSTICTVATGRDETTKVKKNSTISVSPVKCREHAGDWMYWKEHYVAVLR